MRIIDTLYETSPYRLLLVVVLGVVLVGQAIAMVEVTRSQVRKADAYYAQQREARDAAADKATPAASAASATGAERSAATTPPNDAS